MKKLTQQEIKATKYKVAKYIRNNVKKGHYPGFLEIKRRFRIGLHTYFKDIAHAYKSAGLEYRRSNFWKKRKLEKERIAKKAIIDLIRAENTKGIQLTRRGLEAKLQICSFRYFKNLREAYKHAGIEFKPHFGPRTKEEKEKTKAAILSYVRDKVKSERYFPDIHELRRKFRIGTETYFHGGIKEIIEKAGLEAEKFSAFWGLEKERKLLKVAQYILEQRGYKIISMQNKTGPDIVVKKNGDIIPVELKAFRKNSYIPTRLVPKDPISQIGTYIKKLKSPFGIIITTAEDIHPRYKNKIPQNIKIWFFRDIAKMLSDRSPFLKDLEFVRSTFPNFNSEEKIRRIKQKIIKYVKDCAKYDQYSAVRGIQRKFKVNILSYFKDIFRVYGLAGVEYPEHKKRMSGRKPTEAEKEKIRAKIIDFVKNRSKENLSCGYNVIQRELKVAVSSYFSSMREIYKKAKISL